jgi:hypothetical protein
MKSMFILVIVVCVSCNSETRVWEAEVNSVREQIRQLEEKAFDAEFKLDTATIAAMMDENFISVSLEKINSRQEELTGIYRKVSQMKVEDHVIDSLYLDDFRVRLYDNTAVASFFSVSRGTIKGIPFENRRMRWLDIWVKRNGDWKWVASQGTMLK